MDIQGGQKTAPLLIASTLSTTVCLPQKSFTVTTKVR